MEIQFGPFNPNLCGAILLFALCVGCQTAGTSQDQKKEASTLRLHLEVNADGTERNYPVPIYRARPVLVNVVKEPFLSEGDVLEAAVVNTLGGYAIMIQLDRHGTLVLDTATTAYRGKRIAIFSQFGESRWLGAPRIDRRLTDGIFTFTPDASREEAERIVRGLNNVAKELKKKKRL